MATHRTCDGVRRRDFLKIGVLGGTGLSLAGYLRLARPARSARATAWARPHRPSTSTWAAGRPTWTPST